MKSSKIAGQTLALTARLAQDKRRMPRVPSPMNRTLSLAEIHV